MPGRARPPDPEGEDRLASALLRFRELSSAAGIPEVRVYATSALREAPNGPEVAARMRERTGVYPAIISGEREGQLTYLGAADSVEFGADNVLLDLGAAVWSLPGGPQAAADVLSLPLGAIRMTRAFLAEEPPGRKAVRAVQEHVRNLLFPFAARFQVGPGTRVILSSGTAEAAAMAISAGRGHGGGHINGVSFTVAELEALLEQARSSRPAARARIPGFERRGNTIVAGLAVLHAALGLLGAHEVTVSEGALREGMLIEELAQLESYSRTLSVRQRSVLATAERFGANLAHAGQVATLSRGLLDALTHLNERFPEEARALLTAAAALHEAGLIVSQSSHHKHSAYLIRHADLRGFSSRDQELIAQIARYHRRSPPKPSHIEYMALPPPTGRWSSGWPPCCGSPTVWTAPTPAAPGWAI
ncbi:Ppx/GppA phosphatase family protein [Deinococcus malanensis]|uniref:Ppx/GppA phosphatase family protein n=1 Tax=Deinococcus malanensis TaxID=1706855 RepID=UPI00363C6B0B